MEWLEIVKTYIEKGNYAGECKFTDKDKVKQLGARWREKKWTAPCKQTLLALADSGLWHPVGMDVTANAAIVRLLRTEQAVKDDAEMKQRLKRAGPTEEQRAASMLREFGIPDDEPELVAELEEKGLSREIIAKSGEFHFLGPRCGISNASRLKRGIRLNLVTVESLVSGTACETGKQEQTSVSSKKRVQTGGSRLGKKKKKSSVSSDDCEGQEQGAATVQSGPRSVRKRVVDYVESSVCDRCGKVVDRNTQFMECACENSIWKCCQVCLRPVQTAGYSPMCANCGKSE